ncbi:hypothetical protein D3C73_901780 [compost metagenome]
MRDLGQAVGQQAVAGHAQEDAALAEQEGQKDGRQRHHGGGGDPLGGDALAQAAQDQGQRLRAVGEAGDRRRPDRGGRDGDIEDGADHHGPDDTDSQVALGLLGLLGRRGDGVEAVEGEEDDGRRRHDAGLDEGRAEAVGHEGREVGGVKARQGDGDEGRQGGDLDDHQHGVQRRAFARAQQQ